MAIEKNSPKSEIPSKKSSKSVPTLTVLISPDLLSPTASTSSTVKTSDLQSHGPPASEIET